MLYMGGKGSLKKQINRYSMLTPTDVSKLLNVHVNTIRRWSKMGMLKSYRLGSRGDRRFLKEDITRFLTKQETNRNSRD